MKIYNKRARNKYQFLEKFEAGIVLLGAEIKSLRAGRVNLSESFARIRNGEVFLINAHFSSWMGSEKYSPVTRERKLLLHKKQILNLQGKMSARRLALVPTAIYIKGNLAKVEIALCKVKAKYDKRADIRKKTIARDIEKALREK